MRIFALATSAVLLTAVAASAQDYTTYQTTTIVEPVPAPSSAVINAPIEYDSNGVVKAQYFRAEDLSPEQYKALLEEADRVRGYQRSNGVYVRPETAASDETYEIELYEQPATSTVTSTLYSDGWGSAPTQQIETVTTYEYPSTVSAAPVTSAPYTGSTYSAPSYSAAPSPMAHTVAKGDTLYNISKRYNTTVSALKSANGLSSNAIGLGQILTIPSSEAPVMSQNSYGAQTTFAGTDYNAPSSATITTYDSGMTRIVEPVPAVSTGMSGAVYAVLPKDTLYSISRRTCTNVNELMANNGITDPSTLQPGQRLALPAGHCQAR